MDIGETEIRIPSLSVMNSQMVELIKEQVVNHLTKILTLVADEEQIPREQLLKHLANLDINEANSTISLSKKSRKEIDPAQRCHAITSKGKRCTRKKKEGIYCGSHSHTRPYGSIAS